jgi:hypothetical protein
MYQKLGIPSWFPMALGVVGLVGITAVSIGTLLPDSDDPDALPPPQPAFTLPATAGGPQVPVTLLPPTDPSSAPVVTPAPTETLSFQPTPTVSASPPRRTSGPATPPRVTGGYRVLESYGDSFIGQVLLTNTTTAPQGWRVTVVVGSGVSGLRVAWLESLPQPTLNRSGRTYTWTSSQPLAARSTGQLKFHFERSGRSNSLESCTVDGAACRS